MAKKKASLSGRGAEILFGNKPPPVPTTSQDDAPAIAEFERNQQGDVSASAITPVSTTPLEVSPDHPAPLAPVLPPGTVVNVNQPIPARTYDIPPAPDFEPATPPVSAASSKAPVTNPPATGGNVSNPTSTPPSRGTSVVSPTSTGPQVITPASSSAPVSPPPTSTSTTTPTTSGNGRSSSTGVPTSGIPTPPATSPTTTAAGGAVALGSTPVSELLRIAAQAQADRQAALDAAKKAQEQTKVDPEVLKDFRVRMFKQIEELYDKVSTTMGETPWIANYCLERLERARLLILSSDTAGGLSEAEYLVETVRSKVGHKDEVIPESQNKNIIGIMGWQVFVGAVGLFFATMPWTMPNGLSLGPIQLGVPPSAPGTNASAEAVAAYNAGVVNARVFLALLASIGWGGIGAVIATMYNLPWFIQKREFDPAYNLSYIAGPIKGLIVGATMFLIISSGIISNSTTAGVEKFLFVFVVAFLAGFKQEYVFQLFDDLLRVIFRPPQDSNKSTTPPASVLK